MIKFVVTAAIGAFAYAYYMGDVNSSDVVMAVEVVKLGAPEVAGYFVETFNIAADLVADGIAKAVELYNMYS